MKPFLSVITRTYRRPNMLAKCIASLKAQTIQDYEHIVLDDKIGIGIGKTYVQLQTVDVNGLYVLILDDDNILTDVDFFKHIKELVGNDLNDAPDVFVAKILRGTSVLPSEPLNGMWKPKHSDIDMMNVVVSRRLWYECRQDFEERYDGDFSFISSVHQHHPRIVFLNDVIGKTQRISHGRPETTSIVGHRIEFIVACAGVGFGFEQGQIVTASERNEEILDDMMRAGHAHDLDAPPDVKQKQEATQQDIEHRQRILIFCPTYRLELETIQALFNQQGIEYCDVIFTRDNPYPNAKDDWGKNIQLNYEKMRQIVLSQGYDKVFIVESDVIPPFDALQKMLAIDAPVVSALYALRQGEPYPNIWRSDHSPSIGTGMSWSEVKALWGKTINVSGGCMGCLLVDKTALQDFNFITNRRGAPDIAFMIHCWQNKIRQVARLDVVCGHKKPSGEIIYPDATQGWRIEQRKVA